MYPEKLDATLARVARRRCAECHDRGKMPRREWTYITEPELNAFLSAPLARAAGGTQACGTPVFASAKDMDYVALLKTFEPVRELLAKTPRMDMAGAKPAPDVCRDCK